VIILGTKHLGKYVPYNFQLCMYKKIYARSAPKVGVQQLYSKYQDELAGNFFVYLSNDY